MLTAKLTAKKGGLAGAMIVSEHQDLLFISVNGMVQRTSVKGISQMGRATQGVRVMNIADDDRVSAVAIVVEQDEADALPDGEALVAEELPLEGVAGDPRDERRRRLRRGVSPNTSAARPARLLESGSPEKGGGPKLSDMFFGTLEVTGR